MYLTETGQHEDGQNIGQFQNAMERRRKVRKTGQSPNGQKRYTETHNELSHPNSDRL